MSKSYITSLGKTWKIPNLGEFMYKLAWCISDIDKSFCFPYRNTDLGYQFMSITRFTSHYEIVVRFIRNDKTLVRTIKYLLEYTIFDTVGIFQIFNSNIVFDTNNTISQCLTLNDTHREYYHVIRTLLTKKLIMDIEYIILDFLNIPYNYDWLETYFSYLYIRKY